MALRRERPGLHPASSGILNLSVVQFMCTTCLCLYLNVSTIPSICNTYITVYTHLYVCAITIYFQIYNIQIYLLRDSSLNKKSSPRLFCSYSFISFLLFCCSAERHAVCYKAGCIGLNNSFYFKPCVKCLLFGRVPPTNNSGFRIYCFQSSSDIIQHADCTKKNKSGIYNNKFNIRSSYMIYDV